MHKAKLIPKLAIEGVRKNSSSYLPYIFITSFSVFVFFIFNAIYDNPMMQHLPHAQYLLSLMLMGSILLGLILIPILVSTNQFLIKQRKNELGLYNVLGLDQKYIGIMLFIETLILYIITVALGILTAQVFSRLIFLILLNLAGFNVECEFVTTKRSYIVTLIYFAVAFGINFIGSLWQVNKAKPIELMKSGRKGEKQERYLGLKASLGIIILVVGYSIAIRSKIDSWIFSNFFFAVSFFLPPEDSSEPPFRDSKVCISSSIAGDRGIWYCFLSFPAFLFLTHTEALVLISACDRNQGQCSLRGSFERGT